MICSAAYRLFSSRSRLHMGRIGIERPGESVHGGRDILGRQRRDPLGNQIVGGRRLSGSCEQERKTNESEAIHDVLC